MKLIEMVKVMPAFSKVRVISHDAPFNGFACLDALNWLIDEPKWATMKVVNIGYELPDIHLVVLK